MGDTQKLKNDLNARFKSIERAFSKEKPDLNIWNCVHVAHEFVDSPGRIAYFFRGSCNLSNLLITTIKSEIETAVIDAGFEGSTFYY